MSDLNAALIEPLSTPVHAARIAGPLQGAQSLVPGAGTIGLLTVLVARWSGASRSSSPIRCQPNARLPFVGADAVVDAMAPDVAVQVEQRWGRAPMSSLTAWRSSRPRSRRST